MYHTRSTLSSEYSNKLFQVIEGMLLRKACASELWHVIVTLDRAIKRASTSGRAYTTLKKMRPSIVL